MLAYDYFRIFNREKPPINPMLFFSFLYVLYVSWYYIIFPIAITAIDWFFIAYVWFVIFDEALFWFTGSLKIVYHLFISIKDLFKSNPNYIIMSDDLESTAWWLVGNACTFAFLRWIRSLIQIVRVKWNIYKHELCF